MTSTEFTEQLGTKFPETREDIADNPGLVHLHMAAFARLTESAIAVGRLNIVREHFTFADRCFRDAAPDLQNAFYVSYLEHLDFTRRHGTDAQRLLPPALAQGWRDITDYMTRLAQTSKDHGTQNA